MSNLQKKLRRIIISIMIISMTIFFCSCGIDTSTLAGNASQVYNSEESEDDEYDEYYDSDENIDDEDDLDEQVEESSEESDEQMVWVSRTGKCYHSKSTCSNMKDPWQIPLSQAKKTKKACSKCY